MSVLVQIKSCSVKGDKEQVIAVFIMQVSFNHSFKEIKSMF